MDSRFDGTSETTNSFDEDEVSVSVDSESDSDGYNVVHNKDDDDSFYRTPSEYRNDSRTHYRRGETRAPASTRYEPSHSLESHCPGRDEDHRRDMAPFHGGSAYRDIGGPSRRPRILDHRAPIERDSRGPPPRSHAVAHRPYSPGESTSFSSTRYGPSYGQILAPLRHDEGHGGERVPLPISPLDEYTQAPVSRRSTTPPYDSGRYSTGQQHSISQQPPKARWQPFGVYSHATTLADLRDSMSSAFGPRFEDLLAQFVRKKLRIDDEDDVNIALDLRCVVFNAYSELVPVSEDILVSPDRTAVVPVIRVDCGGAPPVADTKLKEFWNDYQAEVERLAGEHYVWPPPRSFAGYDGCEKLSLEIRVGPAWKFFPSSYVWLQWVRGEQRGKYRELVFFPPRGGGVGCYKNWLNQHFFLKAR
ncbi:hypothetical protein F4778DRAFT_750285 [Xylariomycetidae sp. FL2044]|nr:hypothetical protein F4778DRAFT_750285 [Xylariomycetidae sp. FL2044]